MAKGCALEALYDAAWRGDLATPQEETSGAWALAFRVQRHHAGLESASPSVEAFLAFLNSDEEQRSAATLGLSLVARGCLLGFDRGGFDEALGGMERLVSKGVSERARLSHRVTSIWGALLAGDDKLTEIEELGQACSTARLAELVVEANVLRALTLLHHGELPDATRVARRVSRMARAEGMPQQEYLAHLCLAQVRREEGHVHLATRILSALRKVAPPIWDAVLDWQLFLVGRSQPSSGPALGLSQLLASSIEGNASGFEAARRELETCLSGFDGEARVAALAASALDPLVAVADIDAELLPWASGAAERLPRGLHSIVTNTASPFAVLAGHSWVYATPSARPRRFLHPGIGLIRDVRRCEGTKRRHGRTELAAAVLVLAGVEGISLRKFVSDVYGFRYSPKAHDGVLRVLLHRMRKSMEGSVTIIRENDRLSMQVLAPFIVPDPRTSEPSSEGVLRAIAGNPGTSAKAIAKALGVPLRTVQAALSSLVEGGACIAERVGPAVKYRLEDTTFSEPTTFHGRLGSGR